jgi:WD40 repeat protein
MLVAFGTWLHKVGIFDMNTGCSRKLSTGSCFPVMSVAFSPDGQLVVGGDRDEVVTVWEVISGEVQTSMEIGDRRHEESSVHASTIIFSQDGSFVVFASEDHFAIFDAHTWERTVGPLHSANGSAIHGVAVSPSGQSIAINCDRELFIYHWDNKESRSLQFRMPPHNYSGKRVRFSGRQIQLVSESGILTGLHWRLLLNGCEELVEGDARLNDLHMHEGWVLDADGNKQCWVPVIYRAKDIHASFNNMLVMGGGSGWLVLLELLPKYS